MVTLLVFSDALAIVAGKLVGRAALCSDKGEKVKWVGVRTGSATSFGVCAVTRLLTVALLILVGAVVAVELAVAAQVAVDTLTAVALELGVGANRTVLLVAAVVALREAVATPCQRDAVYIS